MTGESGMDMQLFTVVYERYIPPCILEIPNPSAVNGQLEGIQTQIDWTCPAALAAPRLKRWGKFLSAW